MGPNGGAAERPDAVPSIVLITDPRYPLTRVVEVIDAAGPALPEGALVVQLRDKRPDASLVEDAGVLREVTARRGCRFVVNASSSAVVQVARDVGADGVHVPSALLDEARAMLGPAAWISMAAHTEADVEVASRRGASAALVSPIWSTPNKGSPRGTAALEAAVVIARAAAAPLAPRIAIYALGGVDESRAAACAHAGADGAAVIRALLDDHRLGPAEIARTLDAPFRARGRLEGPSR